MRKQTKLVAVLSAAALLAVGASMTSFAGWEKDEDGIWHYYDSDDEMVEDEWRKDGSKWFYLDEDGDMLTDAWVDDDYYVDESGAMLTNAWKYTVSDEDQDEPDEDGERWFYFNNKGKKVVNDTKKINGKTYLFDSDGKMEFGWQQDNNTGDMYYYGDENDGARTESKWLWLERSGNLSDEDLDDGQNKGLCDDTSSDPCDDEGWYWFQSSGKMYKDKTKKKINGKFYMFNEHGQMLYEWIDNKKVSVGSNAQLDAKRADGSVATAGEMLYYNVNEEGWRADGWYQIDGSEAMKTDSDTDWYYIDDGEMYHATDADDAGTTDGGSEVYVMRKKVKVSGNKYFAFNKKGQMQDGLQYIVKDHGFFYFDENGYQKTGKVSSVECEDDDYTFYFTTKNGKNGIGYTGEKDGTLYFNGKRLEADDDYKFYVVDGSIYLVNTKGKIQKATNSKKYDDIENGAYVGKDVHVTTNKKGIVSSVQVGNAAATRSEDLLTDLATDINATGFDAKSYENANDNKVAVPFIDLYDSNDVYTYTGSDYAEGWR